MAEARQTPERNGKKKQKKSLRSEVINFSLIIISVLVGLSILSFSPADDARSEIGFFDTFKLLIGDETVKREAANIHNWLGVFGAYIANFFVNSTLGYFSIVFPVILFIFSWTALLNRDPKKAARASTMILLYALMLSIVSGYIQALINSPAFGTQWYGLIGMQAATALTRAFGDVGGGGVVFILLFALVVFTLKISPREIIAAAGSGGSWVFGSMKTLFSSAGKREKKAAGTVRITKPVSEKQNGNKEEPAPVKILREDVKPRQDPGLIDEAKELVRRAKPKTELREDEEAAEEETEDVVDEESGFEDDEQPRPHPRKKATPSPSGVDTDETENVDEDIEYTPPPLDKLETPVEVDKVTDEELRANADLLRSKLEVFGVQIESVSVIPGPVVTLYELVPAEGVKISRITSLEDDLALALQARGIRIIAPIPGKGAVGVEIPNRKPQIVKFRTIVSSSKFKDIRFNLPIAMGKTTTGEIVVDDLSRMPHLLIAGATGSGKSVGINTIMMSMIYKLHPKNIRFVIIDPKKIELSLYRKLKDHFLAKVDDVEEDIITESSNAVLALKCAEAEMDKRYSILAKAGVRNIQDYNKKLSEGRLKDTEDQKFMTLPYIVIFVDELADLMLTAARDVEDPITRLAQLARAVGIHLVLATQRPSVDVITGLIKANFPARIAYQVASRIDSRTILDQNGAEQLLGNGDMLYLPAGSSKPERIQNSFLSTEEVERVVDFISSQQGFTRPYRLPSVLNRKKNGGGLASEFDDNFEEAARLVVRHQQASTSFLQRRLKLGYGRAARVIDELEEAGIIGPFEGSKGREVLMESEAELDARLTELGM